MSINNYSIQSELGHGGMATVYLAEDKKFLTNVAIKILNKEFAHNKNIRKRFLAEARNIFKMSHPNIIKVTDLIDEGDTVAFVMEYIEGETLKEYLERKGRLNDEEIKTIYIQMLAAVAYVHERGLIHRDIKPSNFMIGPKGQVKLLDFGIAKNTDINSAEYTITNTSQQMGTPMYMSPEQVNETKSVTAQSDIYSLGVVLWQMVMGQKPYDIKTLSNFQLQSKIVNENLAPTHTIWDNCIQKATHKNIDSRFTSTQLFLNDLQNLESIKDDRTIYEKNDDYTIIGGNNDKTIFENKEKATVFKEIKNINTNIYTNEIILLAKLHLAGGDKIYFGNAIPTDKKNNFHSRVFSELNRFEEVKYLLLYDDTVFGTCDDGWAIVSTKDDKCMFVLAEYLSSCAVYSLNFNHDDFLKAEGINNSGFFNRSLKVYFNNPDDNLILYYKEYNISAVGCNAFFNDLLKKT